MEDAIALIDKIIEEHKTISQELQDFEQIANDAKAITAFDKSKEVFMPGRFNDKQGLEAFAQLLDTITEGMHGHFGREEGPLMGVLKEHGEEELRTAMHSLLLEHENLKKRLAYTKNEVTILQVGKLPTQLWQARGYDMRAYITHTRNLFEEHARLEQDLLHTLRSELSGKQARNS